MKTFTVLPQPETMLQHMVNCPTKDEARQVFDALAMQDSYQGGRILPPSPDRPGYTVQTFHEMPSHMMLGVKLADGLRVVIVLPGQRQALGIAN